MGRTRTENIPADVYIQFVRSLFDNAHMLVIGGVCYWILGFMMYARTNNPVYIAFSFILLFVNIFRYLGIRSFHRAGGTIADVEEALRSWEKRVRPITDRCQALSGDYAANRSLSKGNQFTRAALEAALDGYRVAPPEFALVDAVMWGDRFRSLPKARQEELRAANRTIWSPDPDDIDVDADPEEAVSRILAAGEALGADRERLLGYMEDVDALRDAVQERAGGMRR